MANASLRGKNVLSLIIPKRYASAAATPKVDKQAQRALLQSQGLRVTKLPNGIVVASLENNSPFTRVAAVVNAGPRNESYDEQGASHLLRVASNLSTKNLNAYGLSRTVDHLGGQLSVTTTREQTIYNLVSTRDKFEKLNSVLLEVVSKPLLQQWGLEEVQERLHLELDNYNESAELRLVENLHKAAFRNGLSRSLYASPNFIDGLDSDRLNAFRNNNFSADRLTLVGVGVKHELIVRYAEKFHLPKHASSQSEPSRYLGTEVREDNESDLVHVAVACEGVSLSSKEYLASGIVNHAFGTGPRLKWGDGGSRVAYSVLPLASQPAMVSSFNVNYSDSGLFGFHVISDAHDAGKLVKGVLKECAKVGKNGFSNEEITVAKNKLKVSLALSLESSEGLVSRIASNGEHANVNYEDLARQVDSVSNADVNNLAKRLVLSKPSLSAVGNLQHLPRLDELNA